MVATKGGLTRPGAGRWVAPIHRIGRWLRLVSFFTTSMSRLTAAVGRKSDPIPPNPPSLDTAAASSADVHVPIGARMIGTSSSRSSHRRVFNIVPSTACVWRKRVSCRGLNQHSRLSLRWNVPEPSTTMRRLATGLRMPVYCRTLPPLRPRISLEIQLPDPSPVRLPPPAPPCHGTRQPASTRRRPSQELRR